MVAESEAKAKEVYQLVKDIYELEDLQLDPKSLHELFVSGVISRVLAWLCGWDGKRPIRLQCTTGGILKVAATGVGFENNDTKAGTAANAYGAALAFDAIASRVDIFLFDNAAVIKRSKDGVAYDDEFELPAPAVYSYDGTTHSVNIKNAAAGVNARYQIIGWY